MKLTVLSCTLISLAIQFFVLSHDADDGLTTFRKAFTVLIYLYLPNIMLVGIIKFKFNSFYTYERHQFHNQ